MTTIPEEQIKNIRIEGLSGRVLHLPAKKKTTKKSKTIVLVPGQHTSHERMYGIAKYLNRFGEVYSIDLPGYGGMDSFYKIKKDPSPEAYAHYIYTLFKTLKLDNNVWIIGNSLGFLYTTRMLQLHPQVHGSISKVIALVGFTSGKDFAIKQPMKFIFSFISLLASSRLGVLLVKFVALNKYSLRVMLRAFSLVKNRFNHDNYDYKDVEEMELHLWLDNDQRTHARTTWDMFRADFTDIKTKLPFEVVNITAKLDQYFEAERVEKNMLEIYEGYSTVYLNIDAHSPSIIGDENDFGRAIPKELEKLLAQ